MDPTRKLDRKWRGAGPRQPSNAGSGWREQEGRLPQLQPGGRVQRGSGSGRAASSKGDGTGDLFLISAKTTVARGIRVERVWLEEIEQQARVVRKRPALLLGFDRAEGEPRLDWLALPIADQERLIAIAQAAYEGEAAKARALAGLLFE